MTLDEELQKIRDGIIVEDIRLRRGLLQAQLLLVTGRGPENHLVSWSDVRTKWIEEFGVDTQNPND